MLTMDWELIPNEGLPTLKLGDVKAAVREQFGEPRVFRRTSDAPETDQFPGTGIMATYGPGEVVTFIELTVPATPTIRRTSLLARDLGDVLEELRDKRVLVEHDLDGAIVPGWRVGLYAPTGTIEGVSIGE
jgi:hypothetical protein